MTNFEANEIATYYEQLPEVESVLVLQNGDGSYFVQVYFKDGSSTTVGG